MNTQSTISHNDWSQTQAVGRPRLEGQEVKVKQHYPGSNPQEENKKKYSRRCWNDHLRLYHQVASYFLIYLL